MNKSSCKNKLRHCTFNSTKRASRVENRMWEFGLEALWFFFSFLSFREAVSVTSVFLSSYLLERCHVISHLCK
uniref:Uncharacterized protein n=1 Tax=Anguilla anguilla TaxID=7936 RepID=A0A0E9X4F0_ANGAN